MYQTIKGEYLKYSNSIFINMGLEEREIQSIWSIMSLRMCLRFTVYEWDPMSKLNANEYSYKCFALTFQVLLSTLGHISDRGQIFIDIDEKDEG